jgi:CRP-like cAMP-binding protein
MGYTVGFEDVDLFKKLSHKAHAELAALVRTRQLDAGEILFHLGDPGDELFIIQEGRLALFASQGEDAGEDESAIRVLGPGEVLGEMALIDGSPRSLSARAVEPATLHVLAGDDFRDLLRRVPDVAFAVMSGLNERIRYTTTFLTEVRKWVQRVAEGEYDRRIEPRDTYEDPSIAALAADFAQMAARVQEREEALQEEVERLQLRIQIDEAKRERQVEEITGSDYFQLLKQRARNIRGKDEDET